MIYDDEDLDYRVGIEDGNANIRWAEAEIEIPKTRQLFVPEERSTIIAAVTDPLIDEGDTVWVGPGEYRESLDLVEYGIMLISTEGAELTTILGDSVYPQRVIRMNAGILDGFKITQGRTSKSGGGIQLGGTGIVRRCIITENSAGISGGGVFMNGKSELWNCVVFDNSGDNVRIDSSSARIINCIFTLVNREGYNLTMKLANSDLIMYNNIIYQKPRMGQNVSYSEYSDSNNVIFDYSFVNPPSRRFDNLSGIESGDPGFIGYVGRSETYNFHLVPDSPCLNAGHPGAEYLNNDGTRNTIGSTGGPWGW